MPVFFVMGEPRAQPRGRTFISKKTKKPTTISADSRSPVWVWRDAIARQLAGKKPDRPHDGPVMLHLKFYMPRPKKHFKRKGKTTDELRDDAPLWHTNKPDRDNLDKVVLDEMKNLGFFEDDSQVCRGGVVKVYTPVGGSSGCSIALNCFPEVQYKDRRPSEVWASSPTP